jgi:superfamily II DNA or RNA helicase
MALNSNTGAFTVGSLVRVREREWVVLPSEDSDVLNLRPLSGSEAEACGIHWALEGDEVQSTQFQPPGPQVAGDYIAGRLLRDAARLSLRSGAGPFRSLGRLSVRPRPYQFVPLIMALRLDPVRVLIADDVGVGKTIEAALIARELLDRGDIQRVCVLCPPHLCDQWQRELELKFQIQARIVRTSTIARLERELPRQGLSPYRHYPHLVASIDFIKTDRHKHDFLANCPELVIVDEAHSATLPGGRGSKEQQLRYELVSAIAKRPGQSLLLLTATPHSGIEAGFLSLLGLVDQRFKNLDLEALSDRERANLAKYFVQRRRADVEKWMGAETRFPKRDPKEETYTLSKEYRKLFEDVLVFTREIVLEPGLSKPRQRVRYWAALALLRSVMSSPAAAQLAFSKREDRLKPRAEEEIPNDPMMQRETMDPLVEEGTLDSVPEAAVAVGEADLSESDRRRLRGFARRAEEIKSTELDFKIHKAADLVADFLKQGHHPIVYCRFIETAKYVAEELKARLKDRFPDIRILAVTSETGSDEEREARVDELAKSPRRVLVATDCLSEGVNLQDHFNAVLHYDLPWNPNRLEQREGRVDRFGQNASVVRTTMLWGQDNPIDAVVMEVLIRKAREIFRTLGVSVPVPVESESVVQALVQALFENRKADQLKLEFGDIDSVQTLHDEWDRNADRERISRTRFAQHAIKPDEVARELEAVDTVLGDPKAVRKFLVDAGSRFGFSLVSKDGYDLIDPAEFPDWLRHRLPWKKPQKLIFDTPPPPKLEDAVWVGRNHPLVVALSDRVLGEAFKETPDSRFARCGAAFTKEVDRRTVLVLLRLRYRLSTRRGKEELFAEEVLTTGFKKLGDKVEWLPANGTETLELLERIEPIGSISQQERIQRVATALDELKGFQKEVEAIANQRAQELEQAHARLREYTGGGHIKATPHLPPDLLGVYVLLPTGDH